MADYFSLGNRNNAYLTIAPLVARMSSSFNRFIVKHLYECKLSHWDFEIRNLAAKALGKLSLVNPQYCLDALGPILTSCVATKSPPALRHGGVLAVGEILLMLCMHNQMENSKSDDIDIEEDNVITIPDNVLREAFEVVGKLDKGRMYRGRGGEQLREASCMLIENIARAQLNMPIKVQVALVENLNENLKQPHEHVQRAAVKALRQMLFSYFPISPASGPSERLQMLTVLKYINGLKTEMNIAVVRGYTLALGVLPPKLLSKPEGRLRDVFECLANVMSPDHRIAGEADAETRRNAVESISELGEKLVAAGCFSKNGNRAYMHGIQFLPHSESDKMPIDTDTSTVSLGYVLSLLKRACEDYSIDKRGDTGSWSRVVGMVGMERFVTAVLRSPVYSPQVIRMPDAEFSGMVETVDGGIQKGSYVLTAFGLAVVVEADTRAANAIGVLFPPQSLGDVLCSATSSWSSACKKNVFYLKLSKEISLLGQSINLRKDDSNDVIDDHNTRMKENDVSNCMPNESSLTDSKDVPTLVLPGASSCLVIGEREMRDVIGVLLKQLGEKLDSVREVAGAILERLVMSNDPLINLIPDKKIICEGLTQLKSGASREYDDNQSSSAPNISSCISSDGMTNWTRSNLVYTYLVQLLDGKHYFNDIISGIIISIGGLSEDVVRESSSALLQWCMNKKKNRSLRDLGSLSNSIINIFNQNQRNSRVTVPIMKCICILLRNGILDFLHCNSNNVVSGEHADNTASFGVNLLRSVTRELNKCGELPKIRIGVDIYCLLLLFEDPLRPGAFKSLLMLLGHKYPKVRKYAAEQLYIQFISDPNAVGPSAADVMAQLDELANSRKDIDTAPNSAIDKETCSYMSGFAISQDLLDRACELLTCTVWDDALEVARVKRAELCSMMGIALNIKVKVDDEASRLKKSVEKKVDELDSYDALVREAGY